VYDADGTPPGSGSGWQSCGTTSSEDPQPATNTYSRANGNWIFEVALRETTSSSTQGPIASFSWTQDIVAPAKAAVITSHPNDPSHIFQHPFEYTADEGEADLVDHFQCRVDGGAWFLCSGG